MWTLLAAVAVADLPPPKGYVEQCTLANHPGCKTCDAYHGGREPCEALEKQGYMSVCKTRGASVWDEVMCPSKPVDPAPDAKTPDEEPEPKTPAVPEPTTEKKAEPAPESTSRCSAVGGAGGFLLFPLALLAVRRR